MIIRVCMDETYRADKPSAPLMLSGCVATLQEWGRFDSQWARLLNKHGVRYVRSYEFWQQRGEFNKLRGMELVAAVEDFERTIFTHVRFGFSTVLYQEEFERYRDSKGTNLHTLLDSDFGVSLRVAYAFIDSLVPSYMGDPHASVYILVEDGHENDGAVCEIFKQYEKTAPGQEHVIKAAAPVPKRKCFGTQAADMRGCAYLMEEMSGKHAYRDFKSAGGFVQEGREFIQERQLGWFRLPINDGVLTELRDSIILSRPKFTRLYGHLISDASSLPAQ